MKFLTKGYTVFNVEQIDGLPEIYYAKAESTRDPVARIDHAEKFLHATGAKIAHDGTRAYYSLSADAVQMLPCESFRDADSYYATLAHELTHWTCSKNRLDRDFGGHRFGSNAYAQEELVAELGARPPKLTRRAAIGLSQNSGDTPSAGGAVTCFRKRKTLDSGNPQWYMMPLYSLQHARFGR
jgi:antirestriction protein ArdC